jgi:hypothetical protein
LSSIRRLLAAEVRFFPSALADASRKNVPQWLKPNVFQSFCGTAEAVPFLKDCVLTRTLKAPEGSFFVGFNWLAVSKNERDAPIFLYAAVEKRREFSEPTKGARRLASIHPTKVSGAGHWKLF